MPPSAKTVNCDVYQNGTNLDPLGATYCRACERVLDTTDSTPPAPVPPKRPHGFAALSPAERSRIARLGGIAVQAQGTGHRFTAEEAQRAGQKGGMARLRKRRASSSA